MSFNNNATQNSKFINDSIKKIQDQLDKVIINSNYNNNNALYLRQHLIQVKDKIKLTSKKDIKNKKKLPINQPTADFLPLIRMNNNPDTIQKPNNIFQFKNKKRIASSQSSGNINTIGTPIIKEDNCSSTSTMFNKSLFKYLKYSSENKNQQYHNDVLYDENDIRLIRKKEMNKGLLDLIYKGLVPKIADLSPAFAQNGNPFIVDHKNLYNNYKKKTYHDDISDEGNQYNKIKYNYNEIQFTTNSNIIQRSFSKDNKKSPTFITTSFVGLNKTMSTINLQLKDFNKAKGEKYTIINKNVLSSNGEENKYKYKYKDNLSNKNNSKKNINYLNFPIKFTNFHPEENENFQNFILSFYKYQSVIFFIFQSMAVLFRKLNLRSVCVDSEKIMRLIHGMKNRNKHINNKNLIFCITEDDLDKNNLNPKNQRNFFIRIREAFAIKLQSNIRAFLSKVKLNRMKHYINRIIQIQNWYRIGKLINQTKEEIKQLKDIKRKIYNELLDKFKDNWSEISEMTRIEIHINSLSFSNYTNTTIDNFQAKQNLQLNRLIRLIDPNIEIIYISPFKLSDDIINYYFTILNTLGIQNAKNRFHLIVPEYVQSFPPHYSLSQILYFSSKAQNKIKKLIFERNAYIVPGMVSELEEEISFILNCPILMGPYSQTELLFSKSGSKSVFEMNDIAFPISAWDIKTKDEFYSSLAHLIAKYPTINVWIFKINNEVNGRGIAYIEVNKIQKIQLIQMEKKTNSEITMENYQEQIYYTLVSNIKKYVKIAYTSLYPTWDEYLYSFIVNKGSIESCPTLDPSGIMGNPAVPILIEPNGKIKVLPTYDKINIDYFKNVLCISPQQSLVDVNLNLIGEKIGSFLYGQNIIGYVTLEFITFHDGHKILFWGIDMKYGLTDHISSLQYCYFLYVQSYLQKLARCEKDNEYNNGNEIEVDYNNIIKDAFVFSITNISDKKLRDVSLKNFLLCYRYEQLIFDMMKMEGVIFNLPDTLESGIIGICGVVNVDIRERKVGECKLWELMERAFVLLIEMLRKKNVSMKHLIGDGDEKRDDRIDIMGIYSKIKKIKKEKEKEFKKEKEDLFREL